ncbi:sulfurtransferase TusA family protein [Bacillota bacterium LX-D]|nr:sulfurtransferase TusA family protein [Bacillota bacterium LX-D]
MSKNVVDTRGRSCPEPVLMTKKALENTNEKEIQVLADTQVAVENIKRFAERKHYSVEIAGANSEYTLTIKKVL